MTEGNAGSRNAVFTVSLSAASGWPVSRRLRDRRTARPPPPDDYTATSGRLTFAPGETSKTVTVAVIGDLLHEADETFTVDLSNPAGATIADASGAGTITDDDAAPAPRGHRPQRRRELRRGTAPSPRASPGTCPLA